MRKILLLTLLIITLCAGCGKNQAADQPTTDDRATEVLSELSGQRAITESAGFGSVDEIAADTEPEKVALWRNIKLTSGQFTDSPMFNVMTDNPALGDEHDFFRMHTWPDTETVEVQDYTSGKMELVAGESYSLLIYYHNAADPKLHSQTLAENAVLVLSYPDTLYSDESSLIIATLSCGEEDTVLCSNQIIIHADENLHLQAGVVLEGTEPGYSTMMCDNYGKNWQIGYYSLFQAYGITNHLYALGDIQPGYDGAGYIMVKIDVSSAQDF